MRQLFRVSPVLIAILVVLAVPTAGTAAQTSFSGSCQFRNASLKFSPGLKLKSTTQSDTLDATGSCGSAGEGHLSGTLTGPATCLGGQSPATGTGTLTVGSTSLAVKLTFNIKLPTGNLIVDGTDSGSASGAAEFVTPGNLAGMPGCVGDGLRNTTFDANLKTSSALVSGTASGKRKK